MIRVKIRSFGEATGKVLRFDESIGYHSLLRKIIDKLGTTINVSDIVGPHHSEIDDDDLSKLFQLRLGGDSILEDTNEIEHGDDLVLMRIDNDDNDDDKNDNDAAAARTRSQKRRKKETSSTTKSSIKKECKVENDDGADDDDDDEENFDSKPAAKISQESESTDSENEVQEVKKENIPVDDHDVISISSDSDEGEDDEDDSTEEEAESDYWEEEEDSSDEEDEDNKACDDEAEDIPGTCTSKRPSKKRKRNPKPPPASPLEVIMEGKDVPSAPGRHDEQEGEKDSEASSKDDLEEVSLLVNNGAGKKKADRVVKDRIIKLLNTGFHDQSNEHEAKNAMKLAQRLMRKHNLSQALLLKERETKNDQNEQGGGDEVLKGGMVRVHIINRKTGKPSLYARWISQLTHPVCENFDVKSYNQTRRGFRCDVVFYGIYSNAQLAGYAFKVAAERIAQMSAEYKPKTTSRGISTKSSRLSYALGIVEGISEDVKNNLQIEKEKSKRKLERARLAGSKGEAYEESDDEEEEDIDHEAAGYSFPKNDDDGKSDGNKMDSNVMPPDTYSSNLNGGKEDSKPKPISGVDLQSRVKELEEEQQAALVLVNHNEKIAEEVLKEHDIKLSSGRKRKAIDFDRHSYNRGIEDAKEIDMNQRAIRDDVKVKKEKQENT
jgi:hypothetical protein